MIARLVPVLLLAAAGCFAEEPAPTACVEDGDCAAGWSCISYDGGILGYPERLCTQRCACADCGPCAANAYCDYDLLCVDGLTPAPEIYFGLLTRCTAGDSCTLSAEIAGGSGRFTALRWSFSDGGSIVQDGAQAIYPGLEGWPRFEVPYVFAVDGAFQVEVEVDDANGTSYGDDYLQGVCLGGGEPHGGDCNRCCFGCGSAESC